MKKVSLFVKIKDFEEFINRTDIEVIQIDVKTVEQSFMFQESFAAVVYYKLILKNDICKNKLLVSFLEFIEGYKMLESELEHEEIVKRFLNN